MMRLGCAYSILLMSFIIGIVRPLYLAGIRSYVQYRSQNDLRYCWYEFVYYCLFYRWKICMNIRNCLKKICKLTLEASNKSCIYSAWGSISAIIDKEISWWLQLFNIDSMYSCSNSFFSIAAPRFRWPVFVILTSLPLNIIFEFL